MWSRRAWVRFPLPTPILQCTVDSKQYTVIYRNQTLLQKSKGRLVTRILFTVYFKLLTVLLGYSQVVRQGTLTPSSRWFESNYPNHTKNALHSRAFFEGRKGTRPRLWRGVTKQYFVDNFLLKNFIEYAIIVIDDNFTVKGWRNGNEHA